MNRELYAEKLRGSRWCVRPMGTLVGMCGWIDGVAWKVMFVTARSKEEAIAKATKSGEVWR